MAKLHTHGVQIPELMLFLVFLPYPLCLSLASASYATQTKYFINCGSSLSVNFTGRTFLGDMGSDSAFSFTKHRSSIDVVSKNSSSISAPYDTARIFRGSLSSYMFDVNDQGIYIVRLHFMPFTSKRNLSSAVFNVSVPGLTLLRNFRVPGSSTVKEFMLNISGSKFVLNFVPKVSSFAFINALEVFLVPDGLINDSVPIISPSGNNSHAYSGILSQVLHTIYRINVGGEQEIIADNLWRTWEFDDNYILEPNYAQNRTTRDGPNYQDNLDRYLAPDYVYQTAKIIDANATASRWTLIPNVTWGFSVSENALLLVRAHFCDIVSSTFVTVYFNLYVNGALALYLDPTKNESPRDVPFHYDSVVQTGSSRLVNISIGLSKSTNEPKAYLNGLEIWEIKGSWDSKFVPRSRKGNDVRLKLGLVAGSIMLVCIFVFGLVMALKYSKPERSVNSVWAPLAVFGGGSSHKKLTDTSGSSPVPNLHLGLQIPLAEIHFATNKFDEKFIIGRGGFGNVYKGNFRDGTIVAVKRGEQGSRQGFSEFQTEITVLSKIRHRHLVSLIGYCADQSEMILVYEFMEKGSLRDHLYNSNFPSLSWRQRLEICIGAARGLHYLHKGAAGGIIHRDIKSTNILLDENYIAKVADFGLSKFGWLDQSQTHVSTGVKGTFGYLDPEYFKTQQLTEKLDVYSFGVVLLEVLCARPAIDSSLPREQMNLAEWGIKCIQEGNVEKIVDPSIADLINPNSLRKFTEIAKICLQEEDEVRPVMGNVLWDLEYALQLQQTGFKGKLQEDSMTDASTMMAISNDTKFPSFSISGIGEDGALEAKESHPEMSTSEVLSQL